MIKAGDILKENNKEFIVTEVVNGAVVDMELLEEYIRRHTLSKED